MFLRFRQLSRRIGVMTRQTSRRSSSIQKKIEEYDAKERFRNYSMGIAGTVGFVVGMALYESEPSKVSTAERRQFYQTERIIETTLAASICAGTGVVGAMCPPATAMVALMILLPVLYVKTIDYMANDE